MCTPSHPNTDPQRFDPREFVNELAAKYGVDPPGGPAPDPEQVAQARSFIGFKSQDVTAEDTVVRTRAAQILLAGPDDDLRVRVWGLPDDPNAPDAADFSDVAKSIDHHRNTHSPFRPGGGRHERGA